MNHNLDSQLRFALILLLLFGAIAWAVIAVFDYNLITRFALNVNMPTLGRTIYALIGLAAVVYIFKFLRRDVPPGLMGVEEGGSKELVQWDS